MNLLENKGDIRLVNVRNKPIPQYDIYIGRLNKWMDLPESKWRNPFVLERESDRRAVLAQHMKYMLSRPDLIAALPELKGKTLACWCTPKLCHGHNLIDLYNEFVNDDGTVDMEKYFNKIKNDSTT